MTHRRLSRQASQGGLSNCPGTQGLKPGLVGRVRHLKGEQQLRHAMLQEIKEDK
jgi:bifunctional non-homologous end joining protein LigD